MLTSIRATAHIVTERLDDGPILLRSRGRAPKPAILRVGQEALGALA